MKFICLGFFNEAEWNKLTPAEQGAFMESCFAYDDELRRGGHFTGGEALQSVSNAVALRARNGKVEVTDGPYIETKEQLGGILILEARDLSHAVSLMSRHPGTRAGGWEIRPSDEQVHAFILSRQKGNGAAADCGEAKPQAEHQWLQQMAGQWTTSSECYMGPDQPPIKGEGKETVRSLGGLWVVGEGEFAMPDGAPGRTLVTLGFDPHKGRFVGTFVGSMMTHLWVYDGALDADGKTLTLDTVGPNWGEGGMARYQDIYEIVNADHRVMRSRMLGSDGQWQPVMEAHYRRVS